MYLYTKIVGSPQLHAGVSLIHEFLFLFFLNRVSFVLGRAKACFVDEADIELKCWVAF